MKIELLKDYKNTNLEDQGESLPIGALNEQGKLNEDLREMRFLHKWYQWKALEVVKKMMKSFLMLVQAWQCLDDGKARRRKENPRQEKLLEKGERREMSAYIAFVSGLHLFGNLEG